MNASVKILPSHLVDQIAAGEVVERPASVVKELVENSIDAGAERIVCKVEQAGSKLIQVIDDGIGMSREDVELAVRSHTTSKIASSEDLDHIVTLGFRGEALASIAAVCKLSITTRRKNDHAATRIIVEGGGKIESAECGAPVGTEVQVRDLFFNVPARRKFLRSQATEMSQIQSWLTRLCLAKENVHLRLDHANRKLIDVSATVDFAQRTAMLLGRDLVEHLYPIDLNDNEISLRGLLSDPEHSRLNPRGMFFFVNGRYIQDRILQHAVMDACRSVFAQGRYPTIVLKIEMNPKTVDVNVHPQKTEVRFLRSHQVHQAVRLATARVLAESPWIKNERSYTLKTPGAAWSGQAGPKYENSVSRLNKYTSYELSFQPGRYTRLEKSLFVPRIGEAKPETVIEPNEILSSMRYIGTLWSTYILLSDRLRFLIVDQHAAAERITYERMLASINRGKVESQRLLVPLQVELDTSAVSVLESQLERVTQIGFELEPFGHNVIVVKAVPALLSKAQIEVLVKDMLDELADLDLASPWEREKLQVVGRMACHASVRSGQELSKQEVQSLLTQLDSVDYAGTCPHGRPVLIGFDDNEVKRWFHRR